MYNPMDLTGKLILCTGASSGIGRGSAVLLSRLGARVILTGRRMEALLETQALMENQEYHVAAPFDLNDTESIPRWIRDVVGQSGGSLDGLVHSAGVFGRFPLRALNDRALFEVLRLNLGAAVALLKGASARGVVSEGGASFVLVSSVAGLAGEASLVAYSASKGALISAARSAALELAPKRIRVNCVAPGMVETPMLRTQRETLPPENFEQLVRSYPLGLGTVEDVAHSIAYLLSDASRWVTGTTLVVDGGYTA